jgi:hypothetical protein
MPESTSVGNLFIAPSWESASAAISVCTGTARSARPRAASLQDALQRGCRSMAAPERQESDDFPMLPK